MRKARCSLPKLQTGRLAPCRAVLSGDSREPPDWIELIPHGPDVNAIDGRRFKNKEPARVVEAFRRYGLHLPIDYEHASELRAPAGEEAPAAGWVVDLEVRDGSVWGKVEWTPKGAASLTSREYRYISPAFLHTKTGEITELVSAGLTNKPALTQLAGLARTQGDEDMDKELLKLLGLSEDATIEQVLAVCQALKASTAKAEGDITVVRGELAVARAEVERAKSPDLTKFVPRADYDTALARATAAEQRLADQQAAELKASVDHEIEVALKAGKITPATADYHRSLCTQTGGLDRFREFVKAAPVVAGDSGLGDKRPPATGGDTQVTEEQLAIAARCGVSKDALIAVLKA